MSELPINPTLSKMLFNSGEFECVQEMAIIVAMLQVSKKFFFYLAMFILTFRPSALSFSILYSDASISFPQACLTR